MFEPSDTPRVYALPNGADFPRALVEGLRQMVDPGDPLALPRVQLIVNTRRMQRRIRDIFDEGPASLLPRIGLITDLGAAAALAEIPAPVPPLRRRLELVQLIQALLDAQPDLAPRAALYDLADSLAGLMDEMHGEGVSPEDIAALDVSDLSGHWARAQQFLTIAQAFADKADSAPDGETRQRMVAERLVAEWQANPPQVPIILAGSTGSRGTTHMLMEAVARLPQGAVVLPGFDFDMGQDTWDHLDDALTAEDHPQYRFHKLMQSLDLRAGDIRPWPGAAVNPARNRALSLALRPAPVTDQWLEEGPRLADLDTAFADVTLVEAPSARAEALAIAMRLRQAAEDGQTAALITPDRMLTRQVTAALDRWDILPDDSAGMPLQLSPPGRFLRHVAALFQAPLTAEALLTLLKHPLTHSGVDRGLHILLTRELELHLRRHGPPFPDAASLTAFADSREEEIAKDWGAWLAGCFAAQELPGDMPLAERAARHRVLAQKIAQGCRGDGSGGLWDKAAGREALRLTETLIEEGVHGGAMNPLDYGNLFNSVLGTGEVRDRDEGHPNILIWGTLEARVQGADLVILAGLNEGSWPEAPKPDPWLNRQMRHDAGLLLPERRIGLAAHDFQQAVAAREVWITRAIRSQDAETVPSRWVSRLTNLLAGLESGAPVLKDMKARGALWLARAKALEAVTPVAPAPRPAPMPPAAARPRRLSVTEIKRLIRDPYAIYAKHVLKLRALDPLMKMPDALLRGIVVHGALETFIKDSLTDPSQLSAARLMEILDEQLEENVPWAEARLLWRARLERVAEDFVADEQRRQQQARPAAFEVKGRAEIPEIDFTLSGTADRIDIDDRGLGHIYDYKTGAPPSKDAQTYFDKQLLLEAAMLDRGAFENLTPRQVERAAFIGLGSKAGELAAPLEEETPEKVWEEFVTLITAYAQPDQHYTSRRAMFRAEDVGDYDQLARFGEWDATSDPKKEVLE
ncbi:double-strand break repair protein AddB [Maritimibacter alkaliphilus]|uniref:double-strand break repair protein AddB n=1 Tax=Maritimibacter alkaliphilus TaxID=404236 RepID=UPI001C95A373|nr:double-strand break repair protein AddB [Maritimibacter alkaliphilus]MBY6090505.1 double-strand break repair protein AddB [Maritimibacter alkaliphilus]